MLNFVQDRSFSVFIYIYIYICYFANSGRGPERDFLLVLLDLPLGKGNAEGPTDTKGWKHACLHC